MTVSYTCQKPIKFWAKCKINLLYKLNQSLLCVPGCPLLLATRLGTWAPFPLALDLISSLMCLHKSFPLLPSLPSCLIGPHLSCSPHSPSTVLSLGSPNVLHKYPENQLCLLLVCLLCSSAASLFAAYGKHLCPSSPSSYIFLSWLQICALSLSYRSVSICLAYNIFVPQFLCQ